MTKVRRGTPRHSADRDARRRAQLDRPGTPVVLTDVRFPNEAEAIQAAGGRLVRVVRPGQDTSDQHISETALDDLVADVEIQNDGTLDELRAAARALGL